MKSKLNIKSILIIAIIGVLSMLVFGKSFAANTAKVTVETANIRETADATAKIVEQAYKDESVEILEKAGEWYKVRYNNIEGYFRADLIDVPQEKTTETVVEEKKEEVKEEKKEEKVVSTEQTKEEVVTGQYNCRLDTNLRIMPVIYAKSLKNIAANTAVNVLEVNNKWAYVEVEAKRGWILVSKLEKNRDEEASEEQEENKEEVKEETTKEVKMYVNSEIVNLRKEADTSSESLAKLTSGTEVTVYSESNGWSKVVVDGKEGYIATSLLTDKNPDVTSRGLEEPREPIETPVEETAVVEEVEEPVVEAQSASGSELGQQVCNYAMQYLGCPYVYGGTTPDGFDCSGFTQFVYSNFGVWLNRTAESQASNGTYVPKSELKAGDLLIFTSHAGIYLGDGTFIHAANPSSGVVITSLDEGYYVNNYITARRIFD